jgi:hypothetical protein
MKNNTVKKLVLLLCLFFVGHFWSQNDRNCLKELLAIEKLHGDMSKSMAEGKCLYIHYTIKTEDWENSAVVSNIKMYQGSKRLHFFSEQVNIFSDEREVLIVLPKQKVVILNGSSPELSDNQLSESFLKLKRGFLDSCEVQSCVTNQQGHTMLTLKVDRKKSIDPNTKINTMVFEYDAAQQRIISTTVSYRKDYKLKQMTVIYRDIDPLSAYQFPPLRQNVIDREGRLVKSYRDYELMDGRDEKKHK